MRHTTVTIVLELDEWTDCPSGSVRLPGGTAREFHGWLALAAALDSLVRTPASSVPVAGRSPAAHQGGNTHGG